MRRLKAYVRIDGNGTVVPGSVILANSVPKDGNWREIDAYRCCNPTTTTTTTTENTSNFSFIVDNSAEDAAVNMEVSGLGVFDMIIDWGDGSPIESFTGDTSYSVSHGPFPAATTYSVNITLSDPGVVNILGLAFCSILSIDLSQFTALTTLNIGHNLLTAIDVSAQADLDNLTIDSNNLSTLDLSNNLAITSLNCSNNSLTILDLSLNVALTYLECGNNLLTDLDVSMLPDLTHLKCNNNVLDTLDITNNTSLDYVFCDTTSLEALDISNNPLITFLHMNSNQLNTTEVNTTLIALDTFGLSSGFLFITQSPAAPPSGAGATAKTSLQGKGWTIFSN